jgi:hypothetical protein
MTRAYQMTLIELIADDETDVGFALLEHKEKVMN